MLETKAKQKPLHKRRTFGRMRSLFAAMCLCGILDAPVSVQAQTAMVGSSDQLSTLRLVTIGGLKDGMYEAGVDLTMAPGSHTYWKIPGEAGVPPVFTFNGSENVRQAEVKFPVPSRITEEGLDAFGYTGQVVFPVVVTPADVTKAATLHVDVTYAICNHICLPGHSEAKLTLLPRGAGNSAGLVEAALARVPRLAANLDALHVSRVNTASQPTWRLTWTGQTPISDIFSEAPEGFYFSTKPAGSDAWILTADQSVAAPQATKVPVTLVLAGASPVETTRTFDIGSAGK